MHAQAILEIADTKQQLLQHQTNVHLPATLHMPLKPLPKKLLHDMSAWQAAISANNSGNMLTDDVTNNAQLSTRFGMHTSNLTSTATENPT